VKLRLLLGIQAVAVVDKLGGQGGSRVSTMQGDNGELMGRNSCTEMELLNKDVESNRQSEEGVQSMVHHGAQLRQHSLVKPWGFPQV
jgi:hypothetical protein